MVVSIAWPFAPDWSSGISETLSWQTAIQTSRIGAEQRQALRIAPRRQIDLPILLTDQERAYAEILLSRNGGVPWYVPIPHEEVGVGFVNVGDMTFDFDTSYREIAVGQKLLLRGADAFHSEILEVTSIAADHIATTAVMDTYPAATLTPTFLAVIPEKVDFARHTARVYTGTVRFNSVEPTVWPTTARSLAAIGPDFTPTLLATPYPILTTPPNAVSDLIYTIERMWSTIDNGQSVPVYIDKALRGFATQKHEWFMYGRKERQDFRDFVFQLQGKCKPIWVPTFNDDLAIGQGYPNPLGFGDVVAPPGREYFAQFLVNGTVHGYQSSAFNTGERIPGLVWSSSTVVRNSFMSLKRMDSDDVEIMHHVAADGVATASLVFRDAPDIRVPMSMTNQGFSDSGFFSTSYIRTAATNEATGLTDTVTITGAAGGA